MQKIPDYPYLVDKDGNVYREGKDTPLIPSINPQTGYLYVSLWKNNKGKTFAVHRLVAQAFIPNPDSKPEVNHVDSNRTNACADNLEWCTSSENQKHAFEYGFASQETKRNFKNFELDVLINTVIDGASITAIAKQKGVGLSRLSINLKKRAEETGKLTTYLSALEAQRTVRNRLVTKGQCKPIQQFSKDGLFIAEYPSIAEAAKAIDTKNTGSISNVANGRQKTSMGYIWKYI